MTMQYSKYKDKGLTGLANVGNSCYLNSTMQVLSHTYELNNFLNKRNENAQKLYQIRLNKKAQYIYIH